MATQVKVTVLTLTPRPVNEFKDRLTMLTIRNEPDIRRWMTSERDPISIIDSEVWWAKNRGSIEAYLYDTGEQTVGFGMLRTVAEKQWVTLGVLAEHRGLGFGAKIYEHLASVASGEAWAEISTDNMRSYMAASRAGFKFVEFVPHGAIYRRTPR